MSNSESVLDSPPNTSVSLFTQSEDISDEEIFNTIDENATQNLRQKLQDCFAKYSPSVDCCNNLLNILKSKGFNVPTSVGGLMKYKRNSCIRTVSPGEYIHIGLRNQLMKANNILFQHLDSKIMIDIGIDGLPLYKSSNVGLWPILGKNY